MISMCNFIFRFRLSFCNAIGRILPKEYVCHLFLFYIHVLYTLHTYVVSKVCMDWSIWTPWNIKRTDSNRSAHPLRICHSERRNYLQLFKFSTLNFSACCERERCQYLQAKGFYFSFLWQLFTYI